jgi:hypothetical protein
VYRKELEQVSLPDMDDLSRKMKIWLKQDAKDTPECDKAQLELLLQHSPTLTTVYTMRQELCRLWERLADAGAAAARTAGLVPAGRAIRHCCAGALCPESAHDRRGLRFVMHKKNPPSWRVFYGQTRWLFGNALVPVRLLDVRHGSQLGGNPFQYR